VLIIASGCRPRKLNIPGERELEEKGVFDCALCNGGQFHDKTVAVCGAGDRGVTEALYLARIAAKVYLIEVEGTISASAILKERVRSNKKIELRCGAELVKISGGGKVEAVEIFETATQKTETLSVDGVLIAVGTDPNTGFIRNLLSLDSQGRIVVNEMMQTNLPNIFAAGDIRSNSRGQIVTAVGDGATAAIAVQRLMDQL
jgi:thioredoxin reductase (NADPH)